MAALSYQRPSCLPPFHCSVAPCIQPQPQQPPVQQQSVQVLRVRTYVYQHRAAVASIHLLLFLKASAAQRDDYNPPSLSLSLSLSLSEAVGGGTCDCCYGGRLLLLRRPRESRSGPRKTEHRFLLSLVLSFSLGSITSADGGERERKVRSLLSQVGPLVRSSPRHHQPAAAAAAAKQARP
jgi:hypothetical protein